MTSPPGTCWECYRRTLMHQPRCCLQTQWTHSAHALKIYKSQRLRETLVRVYIYRAVSLITTVFAAIWALNPLYLYNVSTQIQRYEPVVLCEYIDLIWFYWMFYDHFSARSLLAKHVNILMQMLGITLSIHNNDICYIRTLLENHCGEALVHSWILSRAID